MCLKRTASLSRKHLDLLKSVDPRTELEERCQELDKLLKAKIEFLRKPLTFWDRLKHPSHFERESQCAKIGRKLMKGLKDLPEYHIVRDSESRFGIKVQWRLETNSSGYIELFRSNKRV